MVLSGAAVGSAKKPVLTLWKLWMAIIALL